jgi:phage terminase small subunit
MKLEPRQRRFVQEYLKDLNATQAYIRAGYRKKTARTCAAQLLAKPNIQKAIQAALKKREKRTEITQDRVLRELAIVGFSDLKNYIEINNDTGAIRAKGFGEMPEGASRALESIREDRMVREDAEGKDSIINEKVTFKMHSKLNALELIGKHLGMFSEKGELKLTGEVLIKVVSALPRAKEDPKK